MASREDLLQSVSTGGRQAHGSSALSRRLRRDHRRARLPRTDALRPADISGQSRANKGPESYVPPSKLKLLNDAVNAACDRALDGALTARFDDPRRCRFDPRTLVCKSAQDPESCLTAKQAKAVADIWAGSKTSAGDQIYPGYMPGAEAAGGWAAYMTGSGPRTGNHWDQSENVLKYMVFENPAWDFRTFNYDKDVAPAQAGLGKMLDAFDPDLDRLRRRGGKLIVYHGWNDPSISPPTPSTTTTASLRGSRQPERTMPSATAACCSCSCRACCIAAGPGPNSFDSSLRSKAAEASHRSVSSRRA